MAWKYQPLPDLSQVQLQAWQKLLEGRTGINFGQHKSILQSGLQRRMREVGVDSYDQYFMQVKHAAGAAAEWTALLNTLTVGETSFFRHPDVYQWIRSYLIDVLQKEQQSRAIESWSVGCSSGEEAYSLAMTVSDSIERTGSSCFFGVIASDICLAALAQARKGLYSKRRLQQLPAAYFERYMHPDDGNGLYEVDQQLRRRVCFVQQNLKQLDCTPLPEMDVITCQNVLIYFRRELQYRVLDQLAEKLRPGGVLVVGVGEAQGWQNAKLERVAESTIQAYIRR